MDKTLESMPFREKAAWLALLAMVVGYGPYFIAVAATEDMPLGNPPRFILWFAIATAVRVIVEFGGRALVAARNRAEARAPADERDRAIERQSQSVAYWLMLGALILVGVILPLTDSGWDVANTALFAIVLCECVRDGVAVAAYRRGWHG